MSEPSQGVPGGPTGPAAGGAGPQQPNAAPTGGQMPPNGRTQLMDVRDRLFHALFIKAALFYAMMVPRWVVTWPANRLSLDSSFLSLSSRPFRRLIELVLFMKALLAFFSLIYIHYTFSMSPATCLQQVADHWPRNGVLHIEINRHLPSHQRFVAGLQAPKEEGMIEFSLPENLMKFDLLGRDDGTEKPSISEILDEANYKNYRMYAAMHNLIDMFKERYTEGLVGGGGGEKRDAVEGESPVNLEGSETEIKIEADQEVTKAPEEETPAPPLTPPVLEKDEKLSLLQELTKSSSWLPTVTTDDEEEDQFIVEYSLEYGFLRLSNATRERMNIPVLYVFLNPDTDKCFGDNLSRFILEKFLGYDDLLMAALKTLAEKEDNKGYLRNLVTGEHFRFISSWWVPRGSFLAAFFVMLLFVSIRGREREKVESFLIDLIPCSFPDRVHFDAVAVFTPPDFHIHR